MMSTPIFYLVLIIFTQLFTNILSSKHLTKLEEQTYIPYASYLSYKKIQPVQVPAYISPHSHELKDEQYPYYQKYDSEDLHYNVRLLALSSEDDQHSKHEGQIKEKELQQKLASHDHDKGNLDEQNLMNFEGMIPYYQSLLGPAIRIKRQSNNVSLSKGEKESGCDSSVVNQKHVDLLQESFPNQPDVLRDNAASFVPLIRVKRISFTEK